jgi:signal transduction histidine kinase
MKFLHRFRIRTKMVIVTMLTAVTALLLAGGTLFFYEVQGFRARLDRDLAMIGKIVSANSVAAISFDDKTAAAETLTALRAEPQILAAGIYNRDGALLATFTRADFAAQFPPKPGSDGSTRAGDRLTYFGAIEDERERQRVGTIYFEADFQVLRRRLVSYAQLLGLVLAASCVVAFVLSALLQRYISEPIVKLASTTKQVAAEGDYSLRAPEGGGGEIGELIGGFNDMLRRIEAAHQELQSFSYSVSHDLRAPLRGIDGLSQALVEDCGPQLSEEGQRYLTMIRSGAIRMGQLIDALLAFAQLGRRPLDKRTVDVNALVRATLDELGAPWPDRRVEIKCGDLPPCLGDRSLLKQVWVNLLANALKYSRGRSPAIIEIGSRREGATTVYFVRDNGTGFDMRYSQKLFGVFQRLHRAEDYEGTGVGLAIVHRVVTRHGGRVWAEAEPDRGAAFFFTLEGEPRA